MVAATADLMSKNHDSAITGSRTAAGWLVTCAFGIWGMLVAPSDATANRQAKYSTVARELTAVEKRVAKANQAGKRKHVRTAKDGSQTVSTKMGDNYFVERRTASGRLKVRTMYVTGKPANGSFAPTDAYRVKLLLQRKVDGILVSGQRHDTVATADPNGTSVPPIRLASLELPEDGHTEGRLLLMTKGDKIFGGTSDAVRLILQKSAPALRQAIKPLGRGMQRAFDLYLAGSSKVVP